MRFCWLLTFRVPGVIITRYHELSHRRDRRYFVAAFSVRLEAEMQGER